MSGRCIGPSVAGDPTVIFLHIGKTAGWTLRQILYQNVPESRVMRVKPPSDRPCGFLNVRPLEDFSALSEAQRAHPRLVVSHMIFGIHQHVPRPSTYITMVRHPVARAVSQYNHVVRTAQHRLHKQVRAGMTLEQYVCSGLALEMDNAQTRALAGDVSTPFGECSAAMLETAKRNLAQHFSVVGLTERFDETLCLLGNTFGWSNLYYVRTNTAPDSQRRDPAPAGTLELIAERNRLDCELYEHIVGLFEQRAGAIPTFGRDIRRLQIGNRLYRPWGRRRYRVKQFAVRAIS